MSSILSDYYDTALSKVARHCPIGLLRESAFRKFVRRNRYRTVISDCNLAFKIKTVIGDPVENKIAVFGIFEEKTSLLIASLTNATEAFIDIGCNVGYFTCLYGSLARDNRVIAIDPNPKMTARTNENIELNRLKLAKTLTLGIGSEFGSLKFYIPESRHSLASFAYKSPRGGDCLEIEAEMTTLDAILSQHEMEGTVIKIDAEGFEYEVLKGLSEKNFDKVKYIICEICSKHLSKTCKTLEDLLSLPVLKHYDIYQITENSRGILRQLPNESINNSIGMNGNYLLVRPDCKIPL